MNISDFSKFYWAATAFVVVIVAVLLVRFFSDETPTQGPVAKSTLPAGVVEMSNAAIKNAGITVKDVGHVTLRSTVTLYGSIKANAEREHELRGRYPGTVRSVVKRPGDRVAKGEALIMVESSESLQTYSIRSPVSGVVLERNANVGETIGSDAVLMKVADLSTVWGEFAVFAKDLGRIKPGLPVRITGADNTNAIDTTIYYVAPAGSGDTQSIVARAVINNAEGNWISGQFATAEVAVDEKQVATAVDPSAIQQIGGKQIVFVRTSHGFRASAVSTGLRSRDAVEITAGLNPGERYAATNSYLIKADLTKGEAEED